MGCCEERVFSLLTWLAVSSARLSPAFALTHAPSSWTISAAFRTSDRASATFACLAAGARSWPSSASSTSAFDGDLRSTSRGNAIYEILVCSLVHHGNRTYFSQGVTASALPAPPCAHLRSR